MILERGDKRDSVAEKYGILAIAVKQLPQLAFQNLPVVVFRQGFEESVLLRPLESGNAGECTEALEKIADMGRILSEVILYDPGSFLSASTEAGSAEEK